MFNWDKFNAAFKLLDEAFKDNFETTKVEIGVEETKTVVEEVKPDGTKVTTTTTRTTRTK